MGAQLNGVKTDKCNWFRGAHYIIGYPILAYISLYFCKLYYILYFSAYTIYSLDHPKLNYTE